MSYNIGSKGNSEGGGGVEYISPKLDIVFKKMFGDVNNSDMLRSLVGAYLKIDTDGKFELSNTEITPEELERKFARLDLRISTEKSEVDVEIQVHNKPGYEDRSLYYWATLYASNVQRGDEYFSAKQTLTLNILDFNKFDGEDFNKNFTFYDPINHIVLSDKAGISYIELPKARNITQEQIRNDTRFAWAAFFNAKTEEEFNMLNETTQNPSVQKAVTVIRELSADEKLREDAKKRQNALDDERSALTTAYRDGIAKGAARGRAEGIVEGRAEGRAERDMEIAATMRKNGMSEELINSILKGQSLKQEAQLEKQVPPKRDRR